MSRLLQSLRNFVKSCEAAEADYVVLGGFALSAYKVVRATSDIDVGLATGLHEKIEKVISAMEKEGYDFPNRRPGSTSAMLLAAHPMLADLEIWLHPDGVVWDSETLKRRLRATYGVGTDAFTAYVLSPEDFIVNKLSRPDRSALDELDVVKVLVAQWENLDREYLERRARQARVWDLAEAMVGRVSASRAQSKPRDRDFSRL